MGWGMERMTGLLQARGNGLRMLLSSYLQMFLVSVWLFASLYPNYSQPPGHLFTVALELINWRQFFMRLLLLIMNFDIVKVAVDPRGDDD